MRAGLVMLGVAVVAHAAVAKPMPHFDLAGLVMQSDAVVLAEKTSTDKPSPYSQIGHYRVERALYGKVANGTDVAVDERPYSNERHDREPRAVLFLANGKLVSSGFRVIEAGKVYRFEQWNNPGGWTVVPQGRDPQDNWQATATAVDLPTFEREVADAVKRADAFAAARSMTDRDHRRAAMLALFAPPGGPHAAGGFYKDVIARGAEQALVKAGDLDGALLVFERDRTAFPAFGFAKVADLAAVAIDAGKPVNVRVAALGVLASGTSLVGEADATRAVIALLGDPSPRVREAAVIAIAPQGAGSSDHKEDALIKKLAREQRAALDKLFATESDPDVLFALLDTMEHPSGRSHGPDVVAHVELHRGDFSVAIRCTRPGVKATAKLLGGKLGDARIDYECGASRTSFGGGGDLMVPTGRYDVAVEVTIAGKPATQMLGTLVVSADGELTVER